MYLRLIARGIFLLLHASDLQDEVRLDVTAKILELAPNDIVHSTAEIEHIEVIEERDYYRSKLCMENFQEEFFQLHDYFKIFCLITKRFSDITSGHIQHNQAITDLDRADHIASIVWSDLMKSLSKDEMQKKLAIALIFSSNRLPRTPECFSNRLKPLYPADWNELAEELELVRNSSLALNTPHEPIKFEEKSGFEQIKEKIQKQLRKNKKS